MEQMLAYCGNRCDLCPIYDENLASSVLDRAQISDRLFQYFGFRIPPQEIGCVGCKNEGKHADPECPVRPCTIEKGVENCAYCESFGCENLKSRMEFIENNVKYIEHIPKDDYKLFIEPYLGKKRLLAIKGRSC